jgi:hypothetical protein
MGRTPTRVSKRSRKSGIGIGENLKGFRNTLLATAALDHSSACFVVKDSGSASPSKMPFEPGYPPFRLCDVVGCRLGPIVESNPSWLVADAMVTLKTSPGRSYRDQ